MLINTNPRFPHFYYILGANLGLLVHGDVSVMGLWYSNIRGGEGVFKTSGVGSCTLA